MAAALYIADFREQAEELLSKFKWGPQFIALNEELLDGYDQAKDSASVVKVLKLYLDQDCCTK